MEADSMTPDAGASWVDRTPISVRPYLRLMRADRPVGVWLLAIPCIWGLLLARPEGTSADDVYIYGALMLVGAYLMRSAGCIYNDIIDRDIDAKVERTANRPLATKTVPVSSAWGLLIGLCLVAFIILIQFNRLAIFIGIGALALVAAYPFMKRITWWPQAWLGLTMNWGVLVGAAAISGTLNVPSLLLYAAGIFWTLGYDTIYAHQDREDDALVGVKSTARRLGEHSTVAISAFFGLTILLVGAALWLAGAGPWTLLVIPAAVHFAWQVRTLDIDDADLCLRLFKSNVTTGWLIAGACLAA